MFPQYIEQQTIKTNGTFLKRILKDRVMLKMYGMLFPYFDPLFSVFDRKLQQLVAGGLINHYTAEYDEKLNPKRFEHLHQSGPEILTMQTLEAGFVVWMVSVFFAVLIFMYEWIIRFAEYLVVKWILIAYFNELELQMKITSQIITNLVQEQIAELEATLLVTCKGDEIVIDNDCRISHNRKKVSRKCKANN